MFGMDGHDYYFLQEDKEKWLAFQKKKVGISVQTAS